MPTRSQMARLQSEAAMEATRLHFRVGTDYQEPVDVLSIARTLGLVLMMQPLDNLLGFYVRQPEAAGIVINSRVPESLQRFTLAHEIGHHVLGHEGTADDNHAVDRFDPDSVVEVQAQAFAASLLMPVPLVNRALRELPASRDGVEIRETDAYLFSRQLGVSYAAGVWALYRRKLLTLAKARSFIKAGALVAKTAAVGQAAVRNARADVWALTAENDELTVLCRVGDEIRVQLPEDTSTGRVWAIRYPRVEDFYDQSAAHNAFSWDGADTIEDVGGPPELLIDEDAAVEVVQDEHHSLSQSLADGDLLDLADQSDLPYADDSGVRQVTFVPVREGTSTIRMELARPWLVGDDAIEDYELDLIVRSRQLAGAGLFAPEPQAWVDEHAVIA